MEYVYDSACDDAERSLWDYDMGVLAAIGWEPALDEPNRVSLGLEFYRLQPTRPIKRRFAAGHLEGPTGRVYAAVSLADFESPGSPG